jgi:hypothetical protein
MGYQYLLLGLALPRRCVTVAIRRRLDRPPLARHLAPRERIPGLVGVKRYLGRRPNRPEEIADTTTGQGHRHSGHDAEGQRQCAAQRRWAGAMLVRNGGAPSGLKKGLGVAER